MQGTRALWVLVVASCICLTERAEAAPSVFTKSFTEHVEAVAAKLSSAESRKRAYSPEEAFELAEESLDLVKLIHRLQETVLETNLEKQQRGRETSKELLLISQGCVALDFTLKSLDNFVATGDRAFIALARQGAGLTQAVRKQLPSR